MRAEVIQRTSPSTIESGSGATRRLGPTLAALILVASSACGSDPPAPSPDPARGGGAGDTAGASGSRGSGGSAGSTAGAGGSPAAGSGGGSAMGGAGGTMAPPAMAGMGGAMDAGVDAPAADTAMGEADAAGTDAGQGDPGDKDGGDASDAVDMTPLSAVDMAPPKPGCGNGVLEAGEKCDQGTANKKDAYGKGACTDTCDEAPYCGDSRIDPLHQEECDQGPANSKDAVGAGKCTDACKNAPFCGDKKVQAALMEECDEGPVGLDPKPGVAGCSAMCKTRAPLPVDQTRCGSGPACSDSQKCVDGICVAKKIQILVVHDTANMGGWKIEAAPFQIGMPGARPWSDPEWRGTYVASMDATATATLIGHEWISVTTLSKAFAGPELATLTLRAAADVYMFVDDRWVMPDWVMGWEDTGMKAVVFESASRPMLSFSIRVKKAQTGEVDLPTIDGTTAYNYFIVVR